MYGMHLVVNTDVNNRVKYGEVGYILDEILI
jgi:hypothetical protein